MQKLLLSLCLGACLLTGQAVFAQTLSNTSNTITVTGACNSPVTGSYTLQLTYLDIDMFATVELTASCTVVTAGPGNYTITATGVTFPSPATNGYWSLADAWPGSIQLTSASNAYLLYWYLDENEALAFGCQ
jgi:hypothetical protein